MLPSAPLTASALRHSHFVAQSHTPQDCCVRFAVVVAFHAATLATGRALPLTRTGLSPVGTRQLSWRTKGQHFEASLIVQAVSWYLRYPLSYRDIEELFLERGLAVDHATLNRWVLAYAPLLERRLRSFRKPHYQLQRRSCRSGPGHPPPL